MTTQKRWIVPAADVHMLGSYDALIPWIQATLEHAGVPLPTNLTALTRLVGQILIRRDVSLAQVPDFFDEAGAEPDPFLLKGMQRTVERLCDAIRGERKIAVYGDYDVDGVTATALMVTVLRALGANVVPYIPHRVDDGYGLLTDALTRLQRDDVSMVVTVDCGVRGVAEADFARKNGLELLITDHHAPGQALPDATIVNPRQPGCPYPFKDLSGVGIAFRLAQALLATERASPTENSSALPTEDDLLDLVALGTVADVVPLRGENRKLVRRGLGILNRGKRIGVRELAIRAGLGIGRIDAAAIGFALGPRLNAAGRMETAQTAYELLTTEDPRRAIELAGALDSANRDRQEKTRACYEAARARIDATHERDAVIIVASPDYPQGIVGLIASRLAETYYRPALVIEEGPEVSKGSARSIPGFNLIEALDQCEDLFMKHGGHKAAAGFTVETANLPALHERLNGIARAQFDGQELQPELQLDALITFRELDRSLLHLLELLEPCGAENPSPLFAAHNVTVRGHRMMGKNKEHLRMTLMQQNVVREAVAFRAGTQWGGKMPERVDLAFAFEWNEYNGMRSLQLNVKDMRAATP